MAFVVDCKGGNYVCRNGLIVYEDRLVADCPYKIAFVEDDGRSLAVGTGSAFFTVFTGSTGIAVFAGGAVLTVVEDNGFAAYERDGVADDGVTFLDVSDRLYEATLLPFVDGGGKTGDLLSEGIHLLFQLRHFFVKVVHLVLQSGVVVLFGAACNS